MIDIIEIFLTCLIITVSGLIIAWVFDFERKREKDMKVINKSDEDADKKWSLE